MQKQVKLLAAVTAFLVLFLAASAAGPARAQAAADEVRGLYLLTDYPALTVQAGTTATVSLRLRNYGLPPARLGLRVDGVPQGWKAAVLGGGQPVAAAMPATGESVPLQLRLEIPEDAAAQRHTLRVVAEGDGRQVSLPIEVALAEELPARLALEASLPALKGGASTTFDYSLTLRNDSGRDLMVSLDAQAPRYFRTEFNEGYGSQQISSVPIEAGQSKDIRLRLHPPSNAEPGDYEVKVAAVAEGLQAQADLALQIVGQPTLQVSGRDGLMSARAQADRATTVPVLIRNTGAAPAEGVQLSSTAPSGWSVTFEPERIERIAAGEQAEVQASITPSARSLAGDYMASISARSQGHSASGDFRITVVTSSTWGIIGVAVIAIAVLILVGAVARFGRR
ncbi:NEW3 domain-containing protein [Orrella sp. JC864]|uniref:NEW3 domain-containing protein n=1 Tax=Orrella sp. JC864 TaxID=3120298 RepID=UPI00300AFF30